MIERYGSLIIPAEAEVLTFEDGEFGTLRAVKNPTYLYSTIPPQILRTKSKKSLRKIALGKQSFPAILTDKSGLESVGVYAELQVKQEILARQVQGCPGVLEVVVFEKSEEGREDMPETGDGIKITSKGYVLEKDLTSAVKTAKFKTVREPVFQNKDLKEDIKQNSFGNCFLLASVLAILSKQGGDEYIRSMMIQDGDYTIVRLYDPNTLQPLYVRVKNSVYVEGGKIVVNHKAMWVHILEKAYTAAGFKKDKDQFVVSFPAFREMYGNGGNPVTAFTILTGQPATRAVVVVDQSYPWRVMDWMLCVNVYNHTRYLIEKFSDTEPEILQSLDEFLTRHNNPAYLDGLLKIVHSQCDAPLEKRIEGFKDYLNLQNKKDEDTAFLEMIKDALHKESDEDKKQLFDTLISYIEKYNQLWVNEHQLITEVHKDIRQMADAGKYVYGLLEKNKLTEFTQLEKPVGTYDDAIAYLQAISQFRPSPPEEVLRRYQEFVNGPTHRWSLPVGTAIYASEAEKLFNSLKTAFTQQSHVLVVSTKAKFPGDKFPGLRPQHAYAVTGVCEEHDADGAIHKFVKVRNPWGHTGMSYHSDGKGNIAVAEVDDLPEFKVDLSHFIDYFGAFTGGKFQLAPPLTSEQQTSLQDIHAANDAHLAKGSFFARHWGKMMMGVLVATAFTALGVLTFGVAPLVLIGIPALIVAVAFAVTVMGAGIGAGVGALTGVAADKCVPEAPAKLGGNSADIIKGINASPSRSSSDTSDTSSLEESSSEEAPRHPHQHLNFRTQCEVVRPPSARR